jgi:hypothetical protein
MWIGILESGIFLARDLGWKFRIWDPGTLFCYCTFLFFTGQTVITVFLIFRVIGDYMKGWVHNNRFGSASPRVVRSYLRVIYWNIKLFIKIPESFTARFVS